MKNDTLFEIVGLQLSTFVLFVKFYEVVTSLFFHKVILSFFNVNQFFIYLTLSEGFVFMTLVFFIIILANFNI